MNKKRKNDPGQYAQPNDNLHLLHERKNALFRPVHGMTRFFPRKNASREILNIGKSL